MMGQHSFLFMMMYSSAVVTYAVDSRLKRSDDVPAFATVVENLSQRVSQLSAQLTLMENKHTALENKLNTALTSVAFHARHAADPFSVASKGVIIFDTVSINTGNGYDRLTGFFTAPVAGTYVFFINCMAVTSTAEETYIEVDGGRIAGCHSKTLVGQPSEQGATLATVHLNAGQKVSVRLLQDAELVRGYYWNTFAGFLIHVDV